MPFLCTVKNSGPFVPWDYNHTKDHPVPKAAFKNKRIKLTEKAIEINKGGTKDREKKTETEIKIERK